MKSSARRVIAALTLLTIGILPAAALATSEQGDPRGADRIQEGCEVPGSGDGLGDTLAIMTRLTCG